MKLPITYPALDSDDPRVIRRLIAQMFQRIAVAFNNPDSGSMSDRPTADRTVGQTFFDTTLGAEFWWDGAAWVNARNWAVGAPNPNVSFQQLANVQSVYAEIGVSSDNGTNYTAIWQGLPASNGGGLYNTSGPLIFEPADGIVRLEGGETLTPVTAPASPASGWTLYVDSGDSNKLKLKAYTGTVVVLGTP